MSTLVRSVEEAKPLLKELRSIERQDLENPIGDAYGLPSFPYPLAPQLPA